jgi:hypothetical protein
MIRNYRYLFREQEKNIKAKKTPRKWKILIWVIILMSIVDSLVSCLARIGMVFNSIYPDFSVFTRILAFFFFGGYVYFI